MPARASAASSGGLSRERLARMDDVLAGYVDCGSAPGLVALVSRRGELHVEAIGKKAIDGRPISRDTTFRISSMTKPIFAAAAMILVEECRLRLDEPVDRLLPELARRTVLKRIDGPVTNTVPANRPITLRDLLTFRMGLGLLFSGRYPIHQAMDETGLAVGTPRPSGLPAPDEYMRRLGTLPLMFPARGAMAVPHWLTGPERAGRARVRAGVRRRSARAPVRATWHEGHRVHRAGPKGSAASRPAT